MDRYDFRRLHGGSLYGICGVPIDLYFSHKILIDGHGWYDLICSFEHGTLVVNCEDTLVSLRRALSRLARTILTDLEVNDSAPTFQPQSLEVPIGPKLLQLRGRTGGLQEVSA